MKLILIICLPFIAIFFDDCTTCSCKTVPCPGFSDSDFAKWFPYVTGQKLIFQNASTFDTINIDGVNKSDSYDASKGCINGDKGCAASCTIATDDLSPAFVRKLQVTDHTGTPFEGNETTKQINLDLYEFSCVANDFADTGLVKIQPALTGFAFTSNYYSSVNIGGNVFSNVQLISMDTTSKDKYSGPYKVFLGKNAGIVAYETYPDLKLWVKL